MNAKDQTSARNSLDSRLRKEARTESPQYSGLLHARIMQRIAHEDTVQNTTLIESARHFHWLLLPTAAAAMLILIPAGLWYSSSRMKAEQKLSPAVVAVPLPSFDSALASAWQPASDQLGQGRYAYLDQDAQRFTRFVAGQFDVLPTEPAISAMPEVVPEFEHGCTGLTG